jgi:adenylate cyclase
MLGRLSAALSLGENDGRWHPHRVSERRGCDIDAISCSIDIQQGMCERNADIPPEKRIEFRVGINLGDVIVEGRDLYGDGVNIAARLEGLAEPGGICISQTVLNHARGKIAFEFEDLGEQALKNIVQPVHVYRLLVNSRQGSGASVF